MLSPSKVAANFASCPSPPLHSLLHLSRSSFKVRGPLVTYKLSSSFEILSRGGGGRKRAVLRGEEGDFALGLIYGEEKTNGGNFARLEDGFWRCNNERKRSVRMISPSLNWNRQWMKINFVSRFIFNGLIFGVESKNFWEFRLRKVESIDSVWY